MTIKTSIAFISGCLLIQTANASFQAQDPRALGMGGVGTAAANSAQAHFYNPSLLANAREDEDFNFEIPVTLRAADPDNLVDSVSDFAAGEYFKKFNAALTAIDERLKTHDTNPITPGELDTLRGNLVTTANGVRSGINSLSNKALAINGNGGLMTSVPNRDISWAAYVNLWADIGAKLNVDPRDDAEMGNYITALNDVTPGNILTALPTSPIERLYSTVSFDAVQITELGISLAIPYQVNNYAFDIGLTPKYMAVKTYSFERTLEQSEQDDEVIDLTNSKDYNSFNLDIGLSRKLGENWKSGLIIKNLIPQSFETPTGSDASISPAVRIGTSYQNNWVTAGIDLDLTRNDSAVSGEESQYLALGAELDVWLAKLRLGYRANLASDNNNTVSSGLGLYLFGLNIDAAVAFGEGETGPNDINAGLQVGLQW